MSRIHDALKRAEQERATSTGTHVEPTFAEPFFDQPDVRNEMHHETMPALQGAGAAARQAMSSAMNYESLIARCPQTEWKPDPLTMLFFQDNENRVGAEEFRTLRSRLYQIRPSDFAANASCDACPIRKTRPVLRGANPGNSDCEPRR